jgi:hypothetical protein
MTRDQVLAFAAAPRCPLLLPTSIQIAPGSEILDVPGFIATQMSRINESDSKRLQTLSSQALAWLAEKLETITH